MDYIDDPTPLLIKKAAYGSIRFERIWLSQLEKIDRSIEENKYIQLSSLLFDIPHPFKMNTHENIINANGQQSKV